MKLLTDLLTEYLDHTEDDSTVNRSRGIRRMNDWQRRILANKNFSFMEDVRVILSVANQQIYDLPNNYQKMKVVRVTSGGADTIVEPIADPKKFDWINSSGSSVTGDYPSFYHIREGKLYLYPFSATNNKNITILYQKKPKILSLENYTTGTVAVTANNKTVTGTGTTWAATISEGSVIIIDGVPYKIQSRDSNTQLTLAIPYEGITAAGLTYTIGDAPDIPEEFQDVLWLGAVSDYYMKKESKTYNTYKGEAAELEARMQQFAQAKTFDNVTSKRRRYVRSINDYPRDIG